MRIQLWCCWSSVCPGLGAKLRGGCDCCVIGSIVGAEWLRVGPPEVQMWCEGSELRQNHKAPACQEFETATRSTRRGSMRHHCALKHGIVKEFLAEFLGTFVLVVSRFPPVDFFALCWLVWLQKPCILIPSR